MAIWREDLFATTGRRGLAGAIAAFLVNPGFVVICRYRISRWFRVRGRVGGVIGSLIRARTMTKYGCEISPDAEIGPALHLYHPIGVIVGDGCKIGRNVTLYQNVTLGRSHHEVPRYPTVGDDVVIYAGAVVVGGVRVGRGAVIGANAVVVRDVPAGETHGGVPARRVLSSDDQLSRSL